MRRRLIRRLLALTEAPARILDIGSGQGDLAAELRADFPEAELCGIDVSQAGVDIAARKVPSARFFCLDLLEPGAHIESLAGWATHAVCSEVLEHVDEPALLLENAAAYLAPGCRLVVTVPGGPISAFDRHIGHRRHFTAADLDQVLRQAGFEVEKATGAGFPFFNLYRMVVIQRGERLVKDVAAAKGAPSSAPARAAMAAFRALFALGTPEGPRGWQIVAVARLPVP
jgi:SAM-dependent methyltransferase